MIRKAAQSITPNINKSVSEFKTLSLSNGHLLKSIDDEFSMNLYGWDKSTFISNDHNLNTDSTSYGYVQNGKCKLYNDKLACSYELAQGMYFSIPSHQKYIIEPLSDDNNGIIMNQGNYKGIFNIMPLWLAKTYVYKICYSLFIK